MKRSQKFFLAASCLLIYFVFGAFSTTSSAAAGTPSFAQPASFESLAPTATLCNAEQLEQQLAQGDFFQSASTGLLSALTTSRTFQGCWSYFPQGQCRAIYREQNNYFICGVCSRSGSPGAGSCSRISPETLQVGYWCS